MYRKNSDFWSQNIFRQFMLADNPLRGPAHRHPAVSVTTVRRAELMPSKTALTRANDLAIRRALEQAGVEFIDAEKGGPGVRLRAPLR